MNRPGARLVLCTALRTEARAVRAGLGKASAHDDVDVVVVGLRAHRSTRASRRAGAADLVVLLGYGGGLLPEQAPGDVVVATAILDERGTVVARPPAERVESVLGALREQGLAARTGPVVSSGRLVHGRARTAMTQAGGTAVDMESATLARVLDAELVVVRVLVDTPSRGVVRAALLAGLRVRRTLRVVAAAVAQLAAGPAERGLATTDSLDPTLSGTVVATGAVTQEGS